MLEPQSDAQANRSANYQCRIPQDLIRPIFELVGVRRSDHSDNNHRTLANLALTSSSFRPEAERILYRSMTSTSLWVQSGFIQTISADMNRAKYVRIYHHLNLRIWVESPRIPSQTSQMLVAYLDNLPTALANMVNLKELYYDIYAPNEQSWSNNARWRGIPNHIISPIQLLSKLMPSFTFKLDNFTYLPQDSDFTVVIPFLKSQPAIRRLSIDTLRISNVIFTRHNPGLMSKLIYLRCTTCHLWKILPTNGIDMLHLGIFATDDDTLSSLLGNSKVRSSLKDLKYLSFTLFSRPHLPFQAQLSRIRLGSVFWLSYNLQSMPNMTCLQIMQLPDERDIEALMDMHSLRMLIIPLQMLLLERMISDHQSGEGRADPTESMAQTAQHIFQTCPHIRYVGYFGKRDAGQVFTTYRIWDAQAGPKEPPASYSISDFEIESRHIFELLPH